MALKMAWGGTAGKEQVVDVRDRATGQVAVADRVVRGNVHTNGLESLWSMIKRAYKGTFHKLSPKHLDRYVQEDAGRQNLQERNTVETMAAIATGMQGKRLRYRELIAPNWRPNGSLPTAA